MDYFLYFIERILISSVKTLHRLRKLLRIKKKNTGKPLKLDLGCGGTKKKGFIGIDAVLGPGVDIKHNIEEGIPFSDNSVNEIYSSHFLEHVQNRKVPFILRECARVLNPKGKITIEVPDLEENLKLFLKMSEEEKWQEGWQSIFGNQKKEFEFHKTGFTKKRLSGLMKVTGFKNVAVTRYKFGPLPSLRARASKPLR